VKSFRQHRSAFAPTIRACLQPTLPGIGRPIVLLLFLLVVLRVGSAQAAQNVQGQRLTSADYEDTPHNNVWSVEGNWAGVENCCGQHNTPYWSYKNPDWWDGGLEPYSQFTRLLQWSSVPFATRVRLSAWLFTSGMTGVVRAYMPNSGRSVLCGTTPGGVQTPISCEFDVAANEWIGVALEGQDSAPQWAVADDWALTPIATPPLVVPEKFPGIGIKYYTNGYSMRTDMAAWSWNDERAGLLVKEADPSKAAIQFDVRDYGVTEWWGRTWPKVNGVNVSFHPQWLSANFDDVDIQFRR
jgi:hypothetical protein